MSGKSFHLEWKKYHGSRETHVHKRSLLWTLCTYKREIGEGKAILIETLSEAFQNLPYLGPFFASDP